MREVLARQSERRRRIVEYAHREVPFYRQRLDALGIDPARCLEPETWRRIPLLTKSDLREHLEEMIADRFRGKPLIVSHSGGSTGTPVEFRFDRDYYDRRIAGWYRADRWAGWDLGERHVLFWLGVGSGVGERRKTEAWKEHLHWRLLRWKTLTVTRLSPERIHLYHRELLKYRPRSIYGIGNAMFTVATLLEEAGLEPPPVRGHHRLRARRSSPTRRSASRRCSGRPSSSDTAARNSRTSARNATGTRACTSTRTASTSRSPTTRARRCRPAEVGQVVVTSFDSMAMPFIRYKMGDLGSLIEKPCPCGRGLPRIGEVLGREMDMIHTPEGNICAGIMIPHFMKEFAHIGGFQFVQEELGRVRLRIVPEKGFDKGGLGFMEEQLRRYVGPTMKIEFEFVDELETLMSGKYKMVVSKIQQQGPNG